MNFRVIYLGLVAAHATAVFGEDLLSTSNYWGQTRIVYRNKVFDAAAILSTNGNDAVTRDWYCNLPRLSVFDDGTTPLPWLEEKAFMLYYFSTVPPIRFSTNCWLAASDALCACRTLRIQCEADLSILEPVATNATTDAIGQHKARFTTMWNRLVSVRNAEPLIADVVTNKFPANISTVLGNDEMRSMQSHVYRRAGIQ